MKKTFGNVQLNTHLESLNIGPVLQMTTLSLFPSD